MIRRNKNLSFEIKVQLYKQKYIGWVCVIGSMLFFFMLVSPKYNDTFPSKGIVESVFITDKLYFKFCDNSKKFSIGVKENIEKAKLFIIKGEELTVFTRAGKTSVLALIIDGRKIIEYKRNMLPFYMGLFLFVMGVLVLFEAKKDRKKIFAEWHEDDLFNLYKSGVCCQEDKDAFDEIDDAYKKDLSKIKSEFNKKRFGRKKVLALKKEAQEKHRKEIVAYLMQKESDQTKGWKTLIVLNQQSEIDALKLSLESQNIEVLLVDNIINSNIIDGIKFMVQNNDFDNANQIIEQFKHEIFGYKENNQTIEKFMNITNYMPVFNKMQFIYRLFLVFFFVAVSFTMLIVFIFK